MTKQEIKIKEIKLEHTSSQFTEKRYANIGVTNKKYCCVVGCDVEFDPDTNETDARIYYNNESTEKMFNTYRPADWQNAVIIWAFIVQAIKDNPAIEPNHIVDYIKRYSKSNETPEPLKPF